MELITDVGGRTGIDCGGFCRFCFYKNLDFNKLQSTRLGCVNCPPDQFGCDECWKPVNRIKDKFKPLPEVLMDLEKNLSIYYNLTGTLNDVKISVTGGADIFNYPHLTELISILKQSEYPVNMGYTSGKTIENRNSALKLVSLGLDELNFSVFSTDPDLRRQWVRDRNSVEAIESLKIFCENMDVNVSAVVIPGINDEEQIFQTASDLEEWGVNSFVLRRFANYKHQGLILNDNKPILEGVSTHSYHEFKELVKMVDNEFSMEVLSFPFYSPHTDFPFAILKERNRQFLDDLPTIESEATVVTGGLAGPFLEEFFNLVDESGMVNVVALEKEIADLITHEDLESVSSEGIKRRVILPYGALVKDNHAEEILSIDGISRKIIRGPKVLTHPYYEGVSFSRDELIRYELKSFNDLIDKINHV
jgi:methanogenesis marker radical SAM protein